MVPFAQLKALGKCIPLTEFYVKLSLYRTFGKVVVLVMLGQDYCLNSGQEHMDSMKSWAGREEEKAGRSVCCVMQSVRVLVMCCGIVL